MVDERELNRTRTDGGEGHSAIPVASWPEPNPEESIFDSTQAEVVGEDDEVHSVETTGDSDGDMLREVETERAATKSNRGKRAAVAVVLLLIVGVTVGLCFWFLSGPGATKKANVPVNKSKPTSESDEAQTQQALNSAGVNLGDGTTVRPPAASGATPPQTSTSTQPVTELSQTGNLTQTAVSEKETADKTASNNNTSTDSAAAASTAKASSGRNE